MSESAPTAADTRRLAEEARDRVRFEEEALELSDQVYRVARRLVRTREEAEDLVQDTYARAFRSWRQYQPGTNIGEFSYQVAAQILDVPVGTVMSRLHRGRRILKQQLADTVGVD